MRTVSPLPPVEVPARAGPLRGLAVAVAVGALAMAAGAAQHAVGAPVVAVLAGVLVASALPRRRAAWAPGVQVASHVLLRAAVVLLGFSVSLQVVWRTVASSGVVMLGTLGVGLGAAAVVGRLLGVRGHRQLLIGVGTAICGASAIGAVAGVVEPEEEDVAYAITVIFAFNVAAVLVFPPLGHLLGMHGGAFGLWAGTAVNDMSSVVAAATAFGQGALHVGVVVKLARTLMIVPICVALALRTGRDAPRVADSTPGGALRVVGLVPRFLLGFLAAAAATTLGLVPPAFASLASEGSAAAITVALAGVGLSARPDHLRASGLRPLAFGLVLWVVVAATSLALQHM